MNVEYQRIQVHFYIRQNKSEYSRGIQMLAPCSINVPKAVFTADENPEYVGRWRSHIHISCCFIQFFGGGVLTCLSLTADIICETVHVSIENCSRNGQDLPKFADICLGQTLKR